MEPKAWIMVKSAEGSSRGILKRKDEKFDLGNKAGTCGHPAIRQ